MPMEASGLDGLGLVSDRMPMDVSVLDGLGGMSGRMNGV